MLLDCQAFLLLLRFFPLAAFRPCFTDLNNHNVPQQLTLCRGGPSHTHTYTHIYMQALAVNEFHDFPVDFSFTAPVKTSVLPPIRITGDGVLNEFGFNQVCSL